LTFPNTPRGGSATAVAGMVFTSNVALGLPEGVNLA
jgi:hypothetical protein